MVALPPNPDRDQVSLLTVAEREVAVLIARGMTVPEIAGELHRSQSAIKRRVEGLRAKLHAGNMATIAAWATRAGLAEHPERFDQAGRYSEPPA